MSGKRAGGRSRGNGGVPAADHTGDPWIQRQIHDELDAMKAAGVDVPDGAYAIAVDMDHLVEQGVSIGTIAEHAIELAERVGRR